VDADRELLLELVTESKEHLASIEPDLLTLERGGDEITSDLLNRIFRAIHSIKGGFSFMGLARITKLSHTMESVLMLIRDGKMEADPEVTDALLEGCDKLAGMVDDVDSSENTDIDTEVSRLENCLPENQNKQQEPPSKELQPSQETPEEESEASPEAAVKIVEETVSASETKPIPKKPTQAGQENKRNKHAAESNETIRVRVDLLNRLMNLAGELVLGRNQIKQTLNGQLFEAAGNRSGIQHYSSQILQTQQLLMTALKSQQNNKNLGSLVEHEFNKLLNGFRQALSFPMLETGDLSAVMQNIDMVTSELQGDIMNTRLQPVGAVFSKFPRVIRDLSKKLNKQIELELEGQDVELDKSIIEALADPLTHLIRNCADHGIESPEARRQAGKPPTGHVLLRAFHESGQVNIEIVDDGGGIDPKRIKLKAVEKGVISEDVAAAMSDQEACNLIFEPGFSTAEQVSDVSGRGVGMDVVRTNINKLGGTIELHSCFGEGTSISLKLPLTLAIIMSLIVTSGGQRFAVPQINIEELVRIRTSDISKKVQTIQGKPILRLREKLLPLVRLSDLLGLPRSYQTGEGEKCEDRRDLIADRRQDDETPEEILAERSGEERRQQGDAINILVLKAGGHHYGLIVEKLSDSEEIVVKPLSGYFSKCICYAGATIMGDGRVAMILDSKGIADAADLSFASLEKEASQTALIAQRESMIEVQPILMFKNGTRELFAINLAMVARVEKIQLKDVERIGDKEFLKYDDHSLRILRLHDYLPVERPEETPENFFVIVPKLVKHPLGIVAASIDDIIQTDAHVDRENVSGTGLLGSAVIEDNLALFVDIYSLFSAAEPDLYRVEDEDGSKDIGLENTEVLLAEDTAFFRAVEEDYLREFGCHVDTAIDGAEAWEKLQEKRYDILVTDIQMPIMDGLELTRKVRSTPKIANLPVIALTSLISETDRQRGIEAGVDQYQTKLDKDSLQKSLLQALESRRGAA